MILIQGLIRHYASGSAKKKKKLKLKKIIMAKKSKTKVEKNLNPVTVKQDIDSISYKNNAFMNKAVPNPYPNPALGTRKMGGSVKKKKK
jgi:hypothetical protein